MVRAINRLSDRRVHTAVPTGKAKKSGKPRDFLMLCDGGGLYLQVTTRDDGDEKTVRRSWIFRYQRTGHKVRDMGLGSLNDIGLEEAREIARECRKQVKAGIDPIEARDAAKARNLAAKVGVMTFDQAAAAYIAQHRAGWRNAVHAAQWPSSLKTYASPVLGKMSVADIETEHVMKVLEPIWTTKTDTATKVRGRIESVLGWATTNGYRKDQNGHDKLNPARWRGHLKTVLAAPGKVRKVNHQRALPYAEVPTFMSELRQRKGIAALAVEFCVLTCVRSDDVLNAKRKEIDRAARLWVIPEFTKTHRVHRVPLSDAALAVIDKVTAITREIGGSVAKSAFLFPNDLTGDRLSENALLAVRDRMGYADRTTIHGLRASFRTWAQEQTNFPWEVQEMSLGHLVGDEVERSYARGDGLKKRQAIMAAWAKYCARPRGTAQVVPLARGA